MTQAELLDHIVAGTKHLLDALSYTLVIGAVVQILPPLAAAMSILWLGMQMFAYWRRKAWRTQREIDADDA